jgi:hypothetical protein
MLTTTLAAARGTHGMMTVRSGSSRSWEGDCIRPARLAQLGLLREVLVNTERVRRSLTCALLRYGWPMTRPETFMAEITRIAAGPTLN